MTVSNIASNTPPTFGHYGLLTGQLFLYAQGRAAFESPWQSTIPVATPSTSDHDVITSNNDLLSTRKCILLGGLSDGLLPVPYTQRLEEVCCQHQWSLVQPILSSSYTGFGHGSLQRDCDELQELMQYLTAYRNGKEYAIVGHSTGCQDAIYFLQHGDADLRSKLRLIVLQAPVSDREGPMQEEGYTEKLLHAQTLVADGNGDGMLPRSYFWAPITAQRFVDLNERGGRDDYFSSDFTDEELAQRLQHVGGAEEHSNLQVLVATSGADEYVPSHIDTAALTDRLVAAMNSQCRSPDDDHKSNKMAAESLYLETANHNLSEGPEDAENFIRRISDMLGRIPKSTSDKQ
jgi:hypothetical protein